MQLAELMQLGLTSGLAKVLMRLSYLPHVLAVVAAPVVLGEVEAVMAQRGRVVTAGMRVMVAEACRRARVASEAATVAPEPPPPLRLVCRRCWRLRRCAPCRWLLPPFRVGCPRRPSGRLHG